MPGALLRFLSYLYHLILALFLGGLSVVALVSGLPLRLEMLPWSGKSAAWWVLGLGLAGLASLVLALRDVLRFPFLLYALAVLVLMVRGYFLTGYLFSGKDEFHFALELTGGALVAVLGGWSQLRRARTAP
ncbi:MAG: hypothetical protein HYR60_09215 [Acidobacteria bacterium]|nr:hypothetical protein [Acidobacteriota bacterium]